MIRRQFLHLCLGAVGLAALALFFKAGRVMADTTDKIDKTDAEWQKTLTPKQYDVLRHEGTEAPFTSKLNDEKHAGTFVCAGCGYELFPSDYKFDSGTGWPSFYDVIPGHVEMKTDHKMILPRTEYHCARCGGHQGHVFNDGPAPTGLRYCNNGVSLKFVPKNES